MVAGRMVGGTPAKTHEECINLICAVCTNLHGSKAQHIVASAEAQLIKGHCRGKALTQLLQMPLLLLKN